MSIQGKNGRQIRKLQVSQSNVPAVGFKNVRALHEASAGDTSIDVTSLTAPAQATANGYLAPTLSDLTKVSLKQYKNNVVVRTGTGQLIQDIDYVISGATTITLSVAALDAQVFEIIIDASPRTGNTIVDAIPLVQTGVLAAESTDFNVGEPFEIGKYPSKQIGSIMVFVDGQIAYRNVANSPTGEGDYYEVHAGAGLGTIVRFNATDSEDRQIVVTSVGSLVNRPDGSQEAYLDTLAGQVDSLREILEDVTDTVIAPGAPNNVDLKNFGDRVYQAEEDIDNLESEKYDKANGVGKKIGWDHTSGTTVAIGANNMHVSPATATGNMILTKLSIFLGTNTAGRVITLGIYDSVAGLPVNKLGQTTEFTVTTTTAGIQILNLQSPVALADGTEYFLVVHTDNGVTVEKAVDNTTNNKQKYYNVTYNSTLPASLGAPTGNSGGQASIGGY